jgi:hypothetical protein
MSTETAAATAAVAKLHGLSVKQTRLERNDEVRHVRDTARQRAEEKGTTTLAEMPHVAAMHERLVVAEHKSKAERRVNHTMRYIRMEARLSKARRHLQALQERTESSSGEAERELRAATIATVNGCQTLLDRAIGDKRDQS